MSEHTQLWDRHSILAEIKRRFGSLQEFAETTPLQIGHFSVALDRPYPKAETLIAEALDVPLNKLWPDRYDARGRRKPLPSRLPTSKASPAADQAPEAKQRFADEDSPNRRIVFDGEDHS